MTIYDSAVEQFRPTRGELASIEVPEWIVDGQPAKIYYHPHPSFGEYLKLARHFRTDGSFDPELFYETLVMFALGADGRPLWFGPSRSVLLEQYDPAVIMRVIGQMGIIERFHEISIGAAKKP